MTARTMALAAAALGAAFFMGEGARAHSWYSEKTDPVFNGACCGGQDCAPLDTKFITFNPDGTIRVTLTREEARTINPAAAEGFDEVIRWDRIQPAEDGRWHLCLMAWRPPGDPRDGYFCIFAPPNT